jgi:hypothetical protein
MISGQISQNARFDLQLLRVIFETYLLPCLEFTLAQNIVAFKQLDGAPGYESLGVVL